MIRVVVVLVAMLSFQQAQAFFGTNAYYQERKSADCRSGKCVCDGLFDKVCIPASSVKRVGKGRPFNAGDYTDSNWIDPDYREVAERMLEARRKDPSGDTKAAEAALSQLTKEYEDAERDVTAAERRQAKIVRTTIIDGAPGGVQSLATGDLGDLKKVHRVLGSGLEDAEALDGELAKKRAKATELKGRLDAAKDEQLVAFARDADAARLAAEARIREQRAAEARKVATKRKRDLRNALRKMKVSKKVDEINEKYGTLQERVEELKDFYDNSLLAVYMQAKLAKIESNFCGAVKQCTGGQKADLKLNEVFNTDSKVRPYMKSRGAR